MMLNGNVARFYKEKHMTRQHYTQESQEHPLLDIALAVAIGLALALLLFFNL